MTYQLIFLDLRGRLVPAILWDNGFIQVGATRERVAEAIRTTVERRGQ